MAVPPRVIKLTVFNDLICPNCCIGQLELVTAIKYCQDTLHLNVAFDLEFLPFRLMSHKVLPEDGPKVARVEFYSKAFGEENFKALAASMTKWGQEKNVNLNFDGVMVQSTQAHRLSRKSYLLGGQKLQLPVLCAIFKAHLEDGKDISDYDVLAEIAESCKVMSKEEALVFLNSGELLAEVNKMCDEAKAKGIKGVPTIIIASKWVITGGQSSDVFVKIFRKLADAGVHAAPSPMPSLPNDNELAYGHAHHQC